VRKNREWQDSVKQLGGEVSKVQDSEAMKRAKEAYERARVNSNTFSLSWWSIELIEECVIVGG